MKNKIILFNVILLTVATLAVFFTGIGVSKTSHHEEAEKKIIDIASVYAANYNDDVTE